MVSYPALPMMAILQQAAGSPPGPVIVPPPSPEVAGAALGIFAGLTLLGIVAWVLAVLYPLLLLWFVWRTKVYTKRTYQFLSQGSPRRPRSRA